MIYFVTKRTDHDPFIYKSQKITVVNDLRHLIEILSLPFLGMDSEFNGKRYHMSEVLLIQLGNKETQVVIDFTEPDILKGWRSEVIKCWNDNIKLNHLFIGHNLKSDYNVLTPYGFKMPDFFDTLLAEQRINLGSGLLNNLKITYERRLKKFMPDDKETRKDFIWMNKSSKLLIKHVMYAAGDVTEIIDIANSQKIDLSQTKQAWFVRNVEFPLTKILGNIELKGLHLDETKWKHLISTKSIRKLECAKEMDQEIIKLGKDNLNLTGGRFTNKRNQVPIIQTDLFGEGQIIVNKNINNVNYNSPDQVLDLIDRLNLPIPTFIENGEEKQSTKEAAVQNYLMEYPNTPLRSFLNKLLEYKGLQKFISSYGEKFLKERIKKGNEFQLGFKNPFTGRVHTVLKQCFTDTGRLSSGEKDEGLFNIQNLPAEKEVRECFCLTQEEIDLGYYFFTVDLSGAELVICAALADDQYLYQLGAINDDIHSPVATKCWRAVYEYRKNKIIAEWKVAKPKEELILITDEQLFDLIPPIIREDFFKIQDTKGKKYILTEDFVVDKNNNKQLRTDFKPMVFGCIYGLRAKKGSETLNIPVDDAQIMIDVIRGMFPKTFKMVEEAADFALIHGYVEFNNRSHNRRLFQPVLDILKTIPNIEKYSDKIILNYVKEHLPYKTIAEIQGEARNAKIQGTQADMIKESMVEVAKHNDYLATEASLLLSVHDELGGMCKGIIFPTTVKNIMVDVANRYLSPYSTNIRMGAELAGEKEGKHLTHWTK